MGALAQLMPLTALTFLIGWLSIAGVPPFSGFWRRARCSRTPGRVARRCGRSAPLTAVLTAYYMGREYFLVFRGDAALASERRRRRRRRRARRRTLHPHDPRWVMTLPLVVLVGLLGPRRAHRPAVPSDFVFLERWLAPGRSARACSCTTLEPRRQLWAFAVVDGALAVARRRARRRALWRDASSGPALEPRVLAPWPGSSTAPTTASSPARRPRSPAFAATVVDTEGDRRRGERRRRRSCARRGGRLRKVQTGYVRNYALGIVGGLVLVLAYVLDRGRGLRWTAAFPVPRPTLVLAPGGSGPRRRARLPRAAAAALVQVGRHRSPSLARRSASPRPSLAEFTRRRRRLPARLAATRGSQPLGISWSASASTASRCSWC